MVTLPRESGGARHVEECVCKEGFFMSSAVCGPVAASTPPGHPAPFSICRYPTRADPALAALSPVDLERYDRKKKNSSSAAGASWSSPYRYHSAVWKSDELMRGGRCIECPTADAATNENSHHRGALCPQGTDGPSLIQVERGFWRLDNVTEPVNFGGFLDVSDIDPAGQRAESTLSTTFEDGRIFKCTQDGFFAAIALQDGAYSTRLSANPHANCLGGTAAGNDTCAYVCANGRCDVDVDNTTFITAHIPTPPSCDVTDRLSCTTGRYKFMLCDSCSGNTGSFVGQCVVCPDTVMGYT